MIAAIFAIIVGFIILTWSADRFVSGAAATAKNWGASPMLIGLTIVSIGTSAPEIMVSLISSFQGHTDIAVGNAIGSNIANMGLVLGVTALIAPLPITPAVGKREIPWLVLVTLIAGACMYNLVLGMLESTVLLVLLIVTLYLLMKWQKLHPEEPLVAAEDNEKEKIVPRRAYFELVYGLALLLGSVHALVWGATHIATLLGVSELVIGLTIIAIGTSLPELAASIASALKGHHDIAIGNVVGSNIFNLLAVLSMPGLVAPASLNASVMSRDYPVMLVFTIFIAVLVIFTKKPTALRRLPGVTLLLGYIVYGFCLYLKTNQGAIGLSMSS